MPARSVLADCNQTIDLNPDLAVSYLLRGIAYAESGALEESIQDFQLYLDLVPNAPGRADVEDYIEQLKSQQ